MTKYSFNIPTKDNPKDLENLIKSIKRQEFKDYEIIVSDASSTNECQSIAKQYKAKYILDKNKKGLAYGRNLGLKLAKGRWVIWIDADHVLDGNFLNNLDKFIEKNNFKCIAPKQKHLAKTFFQKIITAGHQFHEPHLPTVISKEVFKKIGGWDEKLKFYGEDRDFETKIRENYQVGIAENAVVYVPTEKNFYSVYKQARSYGKTLIIFLKKHFLLLLVLNLIYHSSFLPLIILSLLYKPFIYLLYAWMILFVIEMFIIALKTRNIYGLFVPFIKVFRSSVEMMFFIKSLIF